MNKDRVALWMFVLLLLSYVVNAMDRQLFSVLATDVRTSLDLTVAEVGLAATIFTLGMGVAGIPTGYLLGRMSRKNVASLGLIIFSVATFLTAYVQGMPDLLFYRFITGLGEAMQLTALLAIGTTYFYKHRGVAASSLNFTFGVGAIIGPNLGAAILSTTDWYMPFKVFGLLGIVILVPILLFVKPWFSELKVDDKDKETAEPIDESDLADSIWSKKPILLALATVFAGLAIYSYLGLYPTYLREELGFTPQQAGLAVSFYGFGALLSLIGGWFGDRFNYRIVLFISLIISAITGGLLFAGLGSSLALHIVFSFVFGGAISGMVYANLSAGIIKSVKRFNASKASGLFVTSLYVPAAFTGYLLGQLKVILGWTNAALIMISLCAVIAAILSILSRSNRGTTVGTNSAPIGK
ncbi:MFS transporter [Bacillus sp. JJ1566]|uniref:MFS transporter n=1 Tax=Bacillus sp. JJ1566 TaxID=3122961 RepID=UPI002FFE0CAD